MNQEKLYQAVGYLLDKYDDRGIDEIKLIELLYLDDREMIRQTGDSITGDKYFSMKQGPVLSGLHDLIRGRYRGKQRKTMQSVWDSYFDKDEQYNLLKKSEVQIGTENLTRREISILDSTAEQFGDYSRDKLIEYVHNEKEFPEIEWKEAGEGRNTSIPISIDSIRRALGFTENEIDEINIEEKLLKEESAVLRLR